MQHCNTIYLKLSVLTIWWQIKLGRWTQLLRRQKLEHFSGPPYPASGSTSEWNSIDERSKMLNGILVEKYFPLPVSLKTICNGMRIFFFFFFYKFLLDTCPFVGHWYACFGLLVISRLDFKVRLGSLLCTCQRHMWYTFPEIHLWCNTFAGVYGQHSSRSLSPHACFSRGRLSGFKLQTSYIAVRHTNRY